jgi:hypothetical protein
MVKEIILLYEQILKRKNFLKGISKNCLEENCCRKLLKSLLKCKCESEMRNILLKRQLRDKRGDKLKINERN